MFEVKGRIKYSRERREGGKEGRKKGGGGRKIGKKEKGEVGKRNI